MTALAARSASRAVRLAPVGRPGVVALLVGLLVASFSATAVAAAPPTLDGLSFFGTTSPFGENVSYACDGESGTQRGGYAVYSGTGEGFPYPGRWIESGQYELGPYDSELFGYPLADASADFTIDSDRGYVTGVKWLKPTTEVTYCGIGTVPLQYRAIITTPDGGVFTDAGTSTFTVDQQHLSPPWYDVSISFDSPAASAERVLFGNHAVPRSFTVMTADTKRVSPFTLFMPSTVRKVIAYVDGKGATSGSQGLRAVLYRNGTGGGPGAYVTQSFEFTVPAGMSGRWVPFWLAPVPNLAPGVYWIGIQSGGDSQVARFGWRSRANGRRFNGDAFADGAADPFGATGVDDKQLAAFATGSYR